MTPAYPPLPLPQAASERLIALREQREERTLQLQISQLERTAKIQESDSWDWVNAYADMLGTWGYGAGQMGMFPRVTTMNDRRAGRDFPIFQNEIQLQLLRAPARILCATNNYAIGLVEGLTSYIIGTGHRPLVKPLVESATPGAEDSLIAQVQGVLDEFCERVEWDSMEAELFWRDREDGEYLLRHGMYPDSGLTWVRTVESEQCFQPPNPDDSAEAWTFGCHAPGWQRGDSETIDRYYFAHLGNPADGEIVDAAEVVHKKSNVKRRMKRGLTDFCFSMSESLELAEKLRKNMSIGGAVQASIAGVRQHETASLAQTQAFQQGLVTSTYTDPLTGMPISTQRVQPGQILDINKGLTWVDGPAAGNAASYQLILASCLRSPCVRYNAAQWLATADTADSNFATALVASSPFTKRIERMQKSSVRYSVRTWRIVIKNAIEAGALPSDTLERVKIDGEANSPRDRDPLAEAQTNSAKIAAGYMSRQQACVEDGRDWPETKSQIEEEQADMMDQGQQLPDDTEGESGGVGDPKIKPPKPPDVPKPPTAERGERKPPTQVHESVEERIIWLTERYGAEEAGKIVAVATRLMESEAAGHEHAPAGNEHGGEFVKQGGTGGETKKSKALVKPAGGFSEHEVKARLGKLFGKKSPSVEDVASIAGAPDDATVHVECVQHDGKDALKISVEHSDYQSKQIIFKNGSGTHCYLEGFFVKPGAQGKGLGSTVFAGQVGGCKEAGCASMRCHAAKENPRKPSEPHNGYYTWPLFGFDAEIEDNNFDTEVFEALQKQFPDAYNLSDIMATKGGRDWWKANGSDVYHTEFDLADNSLSMRVYEAYKKQRELRKAS